MRERYNFKDIEKKWQDQWQENQVHATDNNSTKEKFYALETFPYPSAAGLHVGHPEGYTAEDIQVRFMRMQGKNVLYTMGWDAFGLPTENYAIKVGKHPKEVALTNTENFKRQVKMFGFSYDWNREINTSSPEYYKWTQWIFIQMFNRGLAYRKNAPVNWCESCKTVLAREQVVDGACERCKNQVIQKDMEQWFFKITDYAEELLSGLETLDWPNSTKEGQRNWIGKSEGATLSFVVEGSSEKIEVFTTRPDTLYGVTYIVLSPEHAMLASLKEKATNADEITAYQETAKGKSELERTQLAKEKTGVKMGGVFVMHPITGEKVSVWVADYVIATYGTGAVMAVPAHDERDFVFAKKYGIEIRKVITSDEECYTGDGLLINSEEFNGKNNREAMFAIAEKANGTKTTTYRLRDWLVSRQRYWGAPIPMIWCDVCGAVPVPEKDLPVMLPDDVDFTPDGQPPLARSKDFQHVACPKCGKDARRDFETMDTFVDSSWYFLRYPSTHDKTQAFNKEEVDTFMPVDLYVIGAEHIVLHLLYARFFTKVFADMGLLTVREPFHKMRHIGLILGDDGQKMSKSRGNVVNPDEVVALYGADAVRLYEMFMGPLEDAKPWSTDSISGVARFLEKVWKVMEKVSSEEHDGVSRVIHQTIKKVTDDIKVMSYNTAIAQMMIAANEMTTASQVNKKDFESFVKVLHPFAPHITEELWHELGNATFLQKESWPVCDEAKLVKEMFEMVIQVNGKIRDRVQVKTGISEDEMKEIALKSERVMKELEGKEAKKIVVIQNRLVNIVI